MDLNDLIVYGSLFAGVEGFGLGFENAGMTCLWDVEKNKYCNMVRKYNFQDGRESFLDVKKVGKSTLRPVDLICGGFPCQDLSVAGKRDGLDGERSGLWFEFARIIAELKPPWVVIENVPGLLSSNKGEDFAIILRWLGECGYYASWRILDSQYWGVAQRRRRLFIVGSLGNTGCVKVLFESEGMPWNPQKGKKTGEGVAATIGSRTKGRGYGDEELNGNLVAATETGAGFWTEGKPRLRCSTAPGQPQTIVLADQGGSQMSVHDDKCPTLRREEHGHQPLVTAYRTSGNCGVMEQGDKTAALNCATDPTQNIVAGFLPAQGSAAQGIGYKKEQSPTIKDCGGLRLGVQQNMAARRLTPRECERLQGFPDDWTRYGIDENGKKVEISDTQRYKQAGNALTVSVAEWIGKRIVKILKNKG